MSKIVVAILCGGRSSEHEISCISAGGILSALDRTRYEPMLIGITRTSGLVDAWRQRARVVLAALAPLCPGMDPAPSSSCSSVPPKESLKLP